MKMAHVSEKKKEVVAEFSKLLEDYPVVGIVNMVNLPAKQVQGMRAKLRDKKTVLKMTKKRLMKLAFESTSKPHLKELEKYVTGMCLTSLSFSASKSCSEIPIVLSLIML